MLEKITEVPRFPWWLTILGKSRDLIQKGLCRIADHLSHQLLIHLHHIQTLPNRKTAGFGCQKQPQRCTPNIYVRCKLILCFSHISKHVFEYVVLLPSVGIPVFDVVLLLLLVLRSPQDS